jgi:hypothetical protein
METFILKESTLNDDTLYLANKNKEFSGGYVAIIEEYSFRTHWSNNKTIKRFKKLERLYKYLAKKYPDFYFYS